MGNMARPRFHSVLALALLFAAAALCASTAADAKSADVGRYATDELPSETTFASRKAAARRLLEDDEEGEEEEEEPAGIVDDEDGDEEEEDEDGEDESCVGEGEECGASIDDSDHGECCEELVCKRTEGTMSSFCHVE